MSASCQLADDCLINTVPVVMLRCSAESQQCLLKSSTLLREIYYNIIRVCLNIIMFNQTLDIIIQFLHSVRIVPKIERCVL